MAAKIADVAPAACAACFQQDSRLRHIDFGACYDGPTLKLPDGRVQPIDDLVLCERCCIEAFALIDPEGLKARISELEGQLNAALADVTAKDAMIHHLSETNTELLEHPIKKHVGQIQMRGIPPDAATEVRKLREERLAASKRARLSARNRKVATAAHANERARREAAEKEEVASGGTR